MSDETLAEKVSREPPWWATAPIWLAAGIVGVPSLIAIAAGYFIAHNVTRELRALSQYNLSELHLLNEQMKDGNYHWKIVENYMEEDLRAQYETCVNSSKNAEQRSKCLTVSQRQKELGIVVK